MWYLLAFGLGQASMLGICLIAYLWSESAAERAEMKHAYNPQDM